MIDSSFNILLHFIVPNFLLVKNTADIVYPTGIQFSIQNLCVTDLESFEKEIQNVFENLLEQGLFEEAYSLAKLHNLSESHITVQKVCLLHKVQWFHITSPYITTIYSVKIQSI